MQIYGKYCVFASPNKPTSGRPNGPVPLWSNLLDEDNMGRGRIRKDFAILQNCSKFEICIAYS